MNVLDLFAGIGGFSLGLEPSGMKTIAFSEIDKFCQKVLKKHWPDVPIYEDVREICRWTWKGSKAQILLRQAFRARTYHSREKVPDFQASAVVYFGRCVEPFAWYDHASRCWRTWQHCLIEGWAQYLGAWPESGMTLNGIAYRLPALERRTKGKGCGLLPTLTKFDSNKVLQAKDNPNRGGLSLYTTILMQEAGLQKHQKSDLLKHYQKPLPDLNPDYLDWYMGYPVKHTELQL